MTGIDWGVIVMTIAIMLLYWRCDQVDNRAEPEETPPAEDPNGRYHKVTPKRKNPR
jgi:hypothetical protein